MCSALLNATTMEKGKQKWAQTTTTTTAIKSQKCLSKILVVQKICKIAFACIKLYEMISLWSSKKTTTKEKPKRKKLHAGKIGWSMKHAALIKAGSSCGGRSWMQFGLLELPTDAMNVWMQGLNKMKMKKNCNCRGNCQDANKQKIIFF